MIFLLLYLSAVFVALGVGVLAAWSDFKGMVIPNTLALIILAAFFVAYAAIYMSGTAGVLMPFSSHVWAGVLGFVVTFILFALKVFGGGDAKLITAYSFWMALTGMIGFLFIMSFFGALLSAVAVFLKRVKPVKAPKEGSWIARLQAGESAIPYGIPIVLAAICNFFAMDYVAPETLSLFLVLN